MPNLTDHQRPVPNPWNIGFGIVALAAALLTLLVWIPFDIKGGVIEANVLGKLEPGDAFFPALLAGALVVLSLIQVISAVIDRTVPDPDAASGKLTTDNLLFLCLFYAIVLIGLTVMYWLGPLTTEALKAVGLIELGYRQLLDTPPYKYIGYIVGGFGMTLGLITWAEGVTRPRAILTVVIVISVSILIFDILLNNVLLPPNADF